MWYVAPDMEKDHNWLKGLCVTPLDEESRPEAGVTKLRAADVSFPWPALFEAYRRGVDLPGIAGTFGCPLAVLERVAERQQWEMLVKRIDENPVDGDLVLAEKLERIEENRSKNMAVAENIREYVGTQFQKLASGELKYDVVVKTKEGPVVVSVEPGPKEIKALTDAARTMSEMTYRAMGDFEQGKQAPGNQAAPAASQAPQITINIPAAVSNLGGPVIENEA